MRYQVAVIGCDNICMVILNQVISSLDPYGSPETQPGGMGLRHLKHLSIYVKKSGRGEQDQDLFTVTDYVRLAIVKNKVTPVIASLPVIFSKSRGYIGATSLLEYLMTINWFKSAGSWKKFDYVKVDPETGEVKTEEISIQRGTFYKLIEQRPEIFEYLCQQVKDMYVSKFPFSKSLSDSNVSEIIKACMQEDTAMPSEEEVNSLDED